MDKSHVTATLRDLIRQTEKICQDSRFRETVLRHCNSQGQDIQPDKLNLTVHAADQMLIHSLQHHQDAAIALSQYFNISLQQFNAAQQILNGCFNTGKESIKVLDFACGYGRLLRFITLWLPRSNVWASEIQANALKFTTKTFGVQGLLSSADPDTFKVDEQFDFIWVASLFSHLPDELFCAWLDKLISLLSPSGVLCFSVRGSELIPEGSQLPDTGILYEPSSEITTLSADIYGTTYVSESYLRETIEKLLGKGHSYIRLPRALANEQDLYLVARDTGRKLPAQHTFTKGPWGWVDLLEIAGSGDLNIQGWAASMDGCGLECVEIRINGDSHLIQPGIARKDVADAFKNRQLLNSGWAFRTRLDETVKDPYVEISAQSVQGNLALLYAGVMRHLGNAQQYPEPPR